MQVETIGDAYMVSSGIPIPNPRHASELADMALTLRHGVTNFRVKYKLDSADIIAVVLAVHESRPPTSRRYYVVYLFTVRGGAFVPA